MSEGQWSAAWSGSKNPGKQRKHRANAAYHHRNKFVSARLKENIRDTVGTKSIPVREGDRVQVQRGDHRGEYGEVREVDREEYKLYIEGLTRETVSGSDTTIPVDPSNVVITKLNLDDDRRVEKYDVTEAEKEEIRAETEEEEEPDEDVEDEAEEPSEESEEEEEEPTEVEAADIDYDELVSENISDIKDRVRDEDLDPAKVLEAEKANKERKTLIEWLENRVNKDE